MGEEAVCGLPGASHLPQFCRTLVTMDSLMEFIQRNPWTIVGQNHESVSMGAFKS